MKAVMAGAGGTYTEEKREALAEGKKSWPKRRRRAVSRRLEEGLVLICSL